jgi:hypothetical protein
MNGLETGIYWFASLATVWLYAYLVDVRQDQFRWRDRVVLGLMLGLTFLARNDAVFLIAGLLAAHLFVAGNSQCSTFKNRFTDCLVAGVVSILVAAPWLLNNLVKFGSIVPISGTAQSHSAGFGHNIAMVPANIFEQLMLYQPIPRHLEAHWGVALLSIASVGVVLGIFWCAIGRYSLIKRRVCIAVGLFGSALSLYYGLFFGAPHFLSRYLSVLSPFLWLATVTVVWALVLMILRDSRHQRAIAFCFVLLGLLSGSIVAGKDFIDGKQHAHRQVVDWVEAHVPEAIWVGAVQTGTLGYFHDRTVNLDGKVNPAALQRIRQDGDVRGYVLESEIQYLVDWEDLSRWVSSGASPAFKQQFELIVHDVPRNLAVIRRVGAPTIIPIDSTRRESSERAN